MEFPNELKYSKEHTWLSIEGNIGNVGITAFAQSELGEIVYVDLPEVGKSFKQDEVFGSVEALKTTSDLFMPVAGEILETNGGLKGNPAHVNNEPYTGGWMIKIKISNASEISKLLDANHYQDLVGKIIKIVPSYDT